jgi:Zn-dependent alcohol dehydrogenases
MKALVKSKAERGLWLSDVPEPKIGINDVLIRVDAPAFAAPTCTSTSGTSGRSAYQAGPVIGHEFVGRIVDMGPGVRGYTLGQRVSAEGHIVCGVCRNCRAGKQHLCPNTVGIGVNRAGAFAEYIAMPSSNLWPIPDQIPSSWPRSSIRMATPRTARSSST